MPTNPQEAAAKLHHPGCYKLDPPIPTSNPLCNCGLDAALTEARSAALKEAAAVLRLGCAYPVEIQADCPNHGKLAAQLERMAGLDAFKPGMVAAAVDRERDT